MKPGDTVILNKGDKTEKEVELIWMGKVFVIIKIDGKQKTAHIEQITEKDKRAN